MLWTIFLAGCQRKINFIEQIIFLQIVAPYGKVIYFRCVISLLLNTSLMFDLVNVFLVFYVKDWPVLVMC